MNKTQYLDRIKTQFESAKAKAESVINPQKLRPVASSSDFIPFHDAEVLIVPQNENLVGYLNPTNATKQTYHDYPLLNVETVLAGDDVSIHAPVWGATRDYQALQNIRLFQSTHPCGVRQFLLGYHGYQASFNPRTRVGCDK